MVSDFDSVKRSGEIRLEVAALRVLSLGFQVED